MAVPSGDIFTLPQTTGEYLASLLIGILSRYLQRAMLVLPYEEI